MLRRIVRITVLQRLYYQDLIVFILAIVILLGSSWAVVKTAELIAQGLNLTLALIGLILVAIGTTLPDLVFGIKSVITKHEGMNLGNLIGSTVINSTLILGITVLVFPIKIEDFNLILTSGLFMILTILIVNFFIATKDKISLREGMILIGLYILFLIIEFMVRS